MKKRTYYIFKEILPNFLLSILFILLFDVLNFKVEITNSTYVFYFSIFYTLSLYIFNGIISVIQFSWIKKISISDLIYNKDWNLFHFFIIFKLIKILFSISIFYLWSVYYNERIIMTAFYIPIIIGISIEILKLLLNKVLKFDKIIMQSFDQKEIDEELDNLINSIIQNVDFQKEEKKEKSNKSKTSIEKIMKRTHDPIEKDEDEE